MELMDAEDYIRERRAELVNECGDQKRCGRVQEAEVQRVKQPDVLLPRRHIHTYAQCQKQIILNTPVCRSPTLAIKGQRGERQSAGAVKQGVSVTDTPAPSVQSCNTSPFSSSLPR
ncbi:hypothetical protein SRHO_G00106850 [Serrasalmus rhombeus]